MKKRLLLGVLALLGLTPSAFAQVTGALIPKDHSVFCPSYYQDVVTASYDFPVKATAGSETAVINVGGVIYHAPVTVAEDGQSLTVNVDSVLKANSVADNTAFSLALDGIEAQDSEAGTVQALAGDYLYRTTLPTCTTNPESGTTLPSKSSTVKFTFSEDVTYGALSTLSGPRFSAVYTLRPGSDDPSTTVDAVLADSCWYAANPTSITITLDNVKDASGYYIPNVSAEFSYLEETAAAKLVSVTPSPETSTYMDAYDAWFVRMNFDAPVTVPENGTAATVTFKNRFGIEMATVDLESWDVTSASSNGENYVEILVPDVPEDAEGFYSATFTLVGATSNGELLDPQPSATYRASLPTSNPNAAKAKRLSKGNGTTGIGSITSSTNTTVDIYSVQGTLVKKNVTSNTVDNLPKGLYIVGGKKVIVK